LQISDHPVTHAYILFIDGHAKVYLTYVASYKGINKIFDSGIAVARAPEYRVTLTYILKGIIRMEFSI
jgi:hypothetical protein